MAEAIESVGFIGLGRMGSGMARNILKAGFRLTVYNRTAAKMQPLIDAGAVGASSPREAAAGADAAVTSLMDDQSVFDIVTGEQGVLAGLEPGGVHIGTTTVSPGHAAHMAELHAAHGSYYVAAPVVGRPDAAEAAQLRTFVAGDPAVITKCDALLRAYCQMVVNVGERHQVANSLKLAVNYMGVSLIELMGEVYAFGEKSGIDAQHLKLLMATMFPQPALQEYAERILARDFDEVGFALTAGLKDVELMLQASTDTRVALPYAGVIRDKFLTAIAHDMGHRDWSAIYEITRMNAGLE
jgi:3-hydroxyisobutyrate dehydrogenase-like beta-hydroxyacid dehydrogenase